MAVKTDTNNETEKRTKRAKSISAMGLVNREGDLFRVSTPSLRGRQISYEVKRDDAGKIRCNCLEFEEAVIEDSKFRCEHILAVKFALVEQNTESVTRKNKPVKVETEITVSKITKDENATELRGSKRSEQKADEVQEAVAVDGQTAAKQNPELNPLANTRGKNKMTQNNLKEMPFITAEEAEKFENMADDVQEVDGSNSNNVLDFPTKLKALRKDLNPELVKQRQGWINRNGEVQMVDYVEWHTVADILDETTPNWMHSLKDIRQIGDIITVTVALTIDGIVREGIGTGKAESEMGIKKAEHDALKRAAVKFGIARELYKQESDTIEREGAVQVNANNNENGFPANPIAKSLSDLVTAKQLGMIRAISREIGIDADEESNKVMSCRTDELSKRAASNLIQHLQDFQQNQVSDALMRRAS
ncbi:MAG: Rad52/Rad22 family DNA repair protein [Aridibacter sp.]